ncbi:LLM class F420-dependent oxidoreductase [Streptomyces griseoluteus]|uniref:LLM class F420-dependent oxidoreductase n=1 Tax=Streptomyces griseoluteus TaxID=29306 RepID=A0A4Z1D523_STRGP|nr:LLM class F420-dependent oxidoreductase [Streptomyces griseoluteus]TGN77440.1 LLM class F420-dependent oxidoreductase [Streptomyces griseoluteus]GHF25445.1 LLM class F420-dependent oxidoreductase [Streptomyces griseoluteus]
MSDSTSGSISKAEIGRYGVWSLGLRNEDPGRRGEIGEAAAELQELGYGTAWLGGSSAPVNALPLLEKTDRLIVATSIQSIWQHDARESAAGYAEVEAAHPGRFLLGLGVSHARLTEQYRRPYSALVEYLDELDAAGVPAGRRVLAALGPKTVRLAGERSLGAIPYLVTPEHTARAREILGQEPLLAPEFAVVLESDPARARELARGHLDMYLQLPNYTTNFQRLGFTEDDLRDGGSDRLIDALYAWGDDDTIRGKVNAFLEAGADHVALQVVQEGSPDDLHRAAWRKLAGILL